MAESYSMFVALLLLPNVIAIHLMLYVGRLASQVDWERPRVTSRVCVEVLKRWAILINGSWAATSHQSGYPAGVASV